MAAQALLGLSELGLREKFGTHLRPEKIRPRSRHGREPLASASSAVGTAIAARDAANAVDPFVEQRRFVRESDDPDIQRVEYELFRRRVYRVRWQLAERFGRPLMGSLVTRLSADFGRPYYDQLIKGKFGSGRATLRRTAWRRGSLSFEIRQLNPLVGGPLFATLADQAAIKSIVASGGTAAPEPDSVGRWWQEPLKPSQPLTARERDALLVAFDGVLARTVTW